MLCAWRPIRSLRRRHGMVIQHVSSSPIGNIDKYGLLRWTSWPICERVAIRSQGASHGVRCFTFLPRRAGIITSRVIQGILAAAFVAAATAKLVEVPMMIDVFDAIGLGQWFRIVTAVVEINGVIGLLTPGLATFGAGWLAVTMFFATLTHLFVLLFVLHTSAAPAALLLALNLVVLWLRREQLQRRRRSSPEPLTGCADSIGFSRFRDVPPQMRQMRQMRQEMMMAEERDVRDEREAPRRRGYRRRKAQH